MCALRAFYRLSHCFVLILALCVLSCSSGRTKSPASGEAPKSAADNDQDALLGQPSPAVTPDSTRADQCAPHEGAASFRVVKPRAAAGRIEVDLRAVVAKLDAACQSCHAPRVGVGGYRFVTTFDAQRVTINGEDIDVPGIALASDKMAAALEQGTMPPGAGSRGPEFVALGQELRRWITAGKPDWTSPAVAAGYSPVWGGANPEVLTALGDCTPKSLGSDVTVDDRFAAMDALPELLSETDLVTFDDLELGKRGTVAYDVSHPLRNDFARKLRHIHVPATGSARDGYKALAVTLKDDAALRPHEYNIPENTRFYKTFFAQRRLKDGSVVYRPVETRIIVVRYGREPLFGTYVWNNEQTEARLLAEPYRDGTPWKDLVLTEPFDESREGIERKYVVPARHRCVQCHQGTASKSFVLGFAPYQIQFDETSWNAGGGATSREARSQMDRLATYGILSAEAAAYRPSLLDLPRQEGLDGSQRNEVWDLTLGAQSFFLGNCAHCHNPSGYAYTEGKVRFDLRAGLATRFPTHLQATRFSNESLRLVPASGDIENSYLFRRFAGSENELRGQDRMPLHTSGLPDCDAVNTVGRWILAHNPNMGRDAIMAYNFGKPCSKESDFDRADPKWFDEDPTENEKNYLPKRADWNDPAQGMPTAYRELYVTPELRNLAARSYATGWWLNVDGACSFPPTTDPEEALRKWDALGQSWVRAGVESPRVPKSLGQLYTTTPGAHFFGQTCVKCHGRLGRGDGVVARDFREIQPANFGSGMFGQKGLNLKTFDVVTPRGITLNLAPQYFVWMATEGTRLREVPPAAQDIVGRYGGKMLGQIRDNCIRLVTGEKAASRDFLLYKEVCTSGNWSLDDPRLAVDAEGKLRDEAAVATWADRGAINAGFLIYDYVATRLAKGDFQPSPGECSLVPEFEPDRAPDPAPVPVVPAVR